MEASKTYGGAYTFSSINLNNAPSYAEVDKILNSLEKSIGSFEESKNNEVLFSNDYAYFQYHGQSLEYHLFDITKDPQATSYYLSEIEKIVGSHKSYLSTENMIQLIYDNDKQGLPLEYALFLDEYWPGVAIDVHVRDYADVCNLNSQNFKNGITTRSEFAEKAVCIYEHIQFHPQFESKLDTIKNGTFIDYLSEFSHALNTLNQAYFFISNEEDKNEADLLLITKLSSEPRLRGRTLMCTRQGSQKPHFDFENFKKPENKLNDAGELEVVYPLETINCEYHLKLNFNDKGIKLPNNYNRVYFALKFCEETNRKHIKLAYIGEHWPPSSGKKKRRH